MAKDAYRLLEEVLQLSLEARAALAESLLNSLDADVDSDETSSGLLAQPSGPLNTWKRLTIHASKPLRSHFILAGKKAMISGLTPFINPCKFVGIHLAFQY